MATWKKVIVSGSDLSQLNNDLNYIENEQDGVILTGSFTGSFDGVLVDGTTATTQTQGDNSNKVATTAYVDAVATAADLNITGSGGTTTDIDLDSQALTFTGNDGLQLSASAQEITATIADGGIANAKLTNDSIQIGTTDIELGATGSSIAGLTLTGVKATGSFTGSFTGDGSGLTGAGGSIISGDAADNQVAVFNSPNTIDGYANFTFNDVTDTLTVTGDQLITGDLTVQGTASFQNTENLLVSDRFVLFASGSTTTGDGGIVIQQATQDVGELFGYDSGTTRWALDSAFDASTSAFTPEAFMAAVVEGTDADPGNAPARYQAKGNIFVGTDEGVWIYS